MYIISHLNEIETDVKAAREKNGVYVPHERFVQDEAEKKVDYLFVQYISRQYCLIQFIYFVM